MVRTGAGGSGDAYGSHAHGSQPYLPYRACTPAANATAEGEFEAEAADGRKEDNSCKTRQDAAPAWKP